MFFIILSTLYVDKTFMIKSIKKKENMTQLGAHCLEVLVEPPLQVVRFRGPLEMEG